MLARGTKHVWNEQKSPCNYMHIYPEYLQYRKQLIFQQLRTIWPWHLLLPLALPPHTYYTHASSSNVFAWLRYLRRIHTPSIGGVNDMDWGWGVGRNRGRWDDGTREYTAKYVKPCQSADHGGHCHSKFLTAVILLFRQCWRTQTLANTLIKNHLPLKLRL